MTAILAFAREDPGSTLAMVGFVMVIVALALAIVFSIFGSPMNPKDDL